MTSAHLAAGTSKVGPPLRPPVVDLNNSSREDDSRARLDDITASRYDLMTLFQDLYSF